MLTDRSTLTQFLIEERRRFPHAKGHLNALVLDIALACKAIARQIGTVPLGDVLAHTSFRKPNGRMQRNIDVLANDAFIRSTEWGGHLAGIVSEELEDVYPIPDEYDRGKYLLVVDPLDGASDADVNGPVGTIFSIMRTPRPDVTATAEDFLQPTARVVCAGYAIYGPATILVISVGNGVHGFTLDRELGEFMLTHPSIRVPNATSEFAVNSSNSRFWEPAIKRYVDECLAGAAGPRGRDFNMRWVATLVAEAHRILMRGGVYLRPRITGHPVNPGGCPLLYEAGPIAFLVEQAGGRAITGRERVLEHVPAGLHEQVGLMFGASEEIERIERYLHDTNYRDFDAPLFGARGLFREPA
jgi:fructose-1,6-bisphosphatase I/sedoheptulose-1,7-bisphosphatase